MNQMKLSLFVLFLGISLPGHTAGINDELLKAAEEGDNAKLEKLLAEGADVGARDDRGRTPLIIAAVKGHTSIVNILLQKGGDVNAMSINGFTALHSAAVKGNSDITRILLARGANVNHEGKYGDTPMVMAAASGNVETAKALLEHRAEINTKTKSGQTPLMRAVLNGRSDMVQFLLKNGADAKAKDNDGKTALSSIGGRCISADAAKALIDGASYDKAGIHEALLNTVTGPHDTASCTALVKFFVDSGINVNHQNDYRNTALILASMWGHTEAVRYLLSKGADVTIKNKAGETALDVAKNREIKSLLKEKQAK
jgi:ankyrin repeat protein